MKFELFQDPEHDHFISRIESILKEIRNSEPERQYFLIDNLLTELYNYFIEFEEDPYAQDIATDLIKIMAVIKEFYAT